MARRPLRAPGKVMKGRQGYTLIEVVVAMLLSCVMIASVFSVALSNKVASSKIDHSLVAVQASRSLQEKLSAYVTSDPTNTIIAGPAGGGAGLASWSLNRAGYSDSQGTVWALAGGSHVVTGPGLPPAAIVNAGLKSGEATCPGGASGPACVEYFVYWPCAGGGTPAFPVPNNCQPVINVSVFWLEPVQ